MTPRDLRWRGLGAILLVAGPCAALLPSGDAGGAHDMIILLCLPVTLFGLVLLFQGRKVALALRVENSPHRMLPALIRSRRRERHMRR